MWANILMFHLCQWTEETLYTIIKDARAFVILCIPAVWELSRRSQWRGAKREEHSWSFLSLPSLSFTLSFVLSSLLSPNWLSYAASHTCVYADTRVHIIAHTHPLAFAWTQFSLHPFEFSLHRHTQTHRSWIHQPTHTQNTKKVNSLRIWSWCFLEIS